MANSPGLFAVNQRFLLKHDVMYQQEFLNDRKQAWAVCHDIMSHNMPSLFAVN